MISLIFSVFVSRNANAKATSFHRFTPFPSEDMTKVGKSAGAGWRTFPCFPLLILTVVLLSSTWLYFPLLLEVGFAFQCAGRNGSRGHVYFSMYRKERKIRLFCAANENAVMPISLYEENGNYFICEVWVIILPFLLLRNNKSFTFVLN